MDDNWQVAEGVGWISLAGFGRIDPRRDNEEGGRQYFTAMTDNNEYARVTGDAIAGGPEDWFFEFDEPFLLADSADSCLEVEISLLPGGRYAVKYRRGFWPNSETGGW